MAPQPYIYIYIYIYIDRAPNGEQDALADYNGRTPRDAPRIPRKSPVVGCAVFILFRGGMLSVFFVDFFWRLSPLIFVLFRVLSVLGFSRRIFRYEFWIDCPEIFGEDFGP